MGIDTLLAIMFAIATISSVVSLALAKQMSERWSQFARELIDSQEQMNREWATFYLKISGCAGACKIITEEKKDEQQS